MPSAPRVRQAVILGVRAAALLSCALAGPLAAAPAAVEGRVVLQGAGTPLPDAEVSVVGRPGSVRTDAEGRFTWAPPPAPPFDVLVSLPGGRSARLVRVERLDSPLTLEVSYAVSEALTVTAGVAPGTEGGPANATATLTAEDLGARVTANLGQAIENVAGASTASEGQAAVPVLRGLARGRTLVLIDDARVTAERRVGPSATFLDPTAIEAVEVSRGPGSVAYGSDAFGGVLHVRTRRAVPGTPLGGRLEGTLGAGIPQQRASAQLTRGFARGGILLQGHFRNFEDWTSPGGRVFNSGAQDAGLLLRFDHVLGGGLLSAGVQGDFGRDIERPRDNAQAVRFFYPEEDSRRLSLRWERGAAEGWTRLGAHAFVGRYALVTDQDRAATPARPRSIERAEVSADDFQLKAFAERPLGRARVEAGVDMHGRRGLEALDIGLFYDAAGALERTTTNVSIADARRIDAGVYVGLEAPLRDTILVSAGVRGDRVASRNRGGYFGDREARNRAGSGFAALTAGPFHGFSATAQLARGFRDPVLSDRYFRGPTGRGFITGNPDVVPESSVQFDGAVRFSRGRWRAALYGYQYRIDDLVERYQTDVDTFFFRNRGRARLRGVEAEVQASLPSRLTVDLSAHLIRGRALDDGTSLDDVPPPTVTARLGRQFERGSLWARTAFYDALAHPGPTEQARDAHQVLDAGGGLRVSSRLEVHVVGRNLTDETYLASPDARATLAPGRSAALTVAIAF